MSACLTLIIMSEKEFEIVNFHDHWGELREQHTPKPYELFRQLIHCAVKPEKPKKKMPITEDISDEKPMAIPYEHGLTTDVMRHTIKLNWHVKIMRKLIRNVQNNKKDIRRCPQIPKMVVKRFKPTDEKLEAEKQHRFNMGQDLTPLCVVDDDMIQKMIEKSILTIMAQIGFDKTSKTVLLTFADVVKEMLTKLALICHSNSQKDLIRGNVAFTDVLDKSFTSIGFSGLDCVKDYFTTTLIARRDLALRKSNYAFMKYKQLTAEAGFIELKQGRTQQVSKVTAFSSQ